MINSQKVLYSNGKNDECMTPDYAVAPLLKYIPANKTVWCPFDTSQSAFVRLLRANGNRVIFSHIDNGQDFYTYEPQEHYDVIISNPPFTNKAKIFERAISLNKPFLLLAPCTWFNDSAICRLFKDKELQIMFFDKRIKFFVNGVVNNKITFSSCFLGLGILPKQIILEKITTPAKTNKGGGQ